MYAKTEYGFGIDNRIKAIDLSHNSDIRTLWAYGNELDGLNLSANERIWYVDVRANAWDACTVNDFMHLLPVYVSPGQEAEESTQATKKLLVK